VTRGAARDAGARFTFEPLSEADLPMLRGWLERPHVAAWWGPAETVEELRADYLDGAGAPNATRAWIACEDGLPIGFIQSYGVLGAGDGWWEDETDPGARGIDQFLADAHRLGAGLGRAMIRAFVDRLFEDPAVSVVQTDPDPNNERAVRCYRGAGFEDVGPVTTPDGPALLMRCRRDAHTRRPDERSRPMPPRLHAVDHIHVFVADRAAAEGWYRRVLGLVRKPELAFWADEGGPLTLTNADDSVHIALFERPRQPCRSTVALRVGAVELHAWRQHLAAALGQAPALEDHAVAWSIYFSDPDGNPYEITTYEHGAFAQLAAAGGSSVE
jgi:RimJ/RimL family protein N-acetyltransferase/catechol 2,3-dioxygenase-like lactoylglutathione lyase family enzyme